MSKVLSRTHTRQSLICIEYIFRVTQQFYAEIKHSVLLKYLIRKTWTIQLECFISA